MWQALDIGCLAKFKAMGDGYIPKYGCDKGEPTCSQGSFNWFSAGLS